MGIERIQDLFGRHGAQRLGAALFTSALLVPLAACSPTGAGSTDRQEQTSLTPAAVARTDRQEQTPLVPAAVSAGVPSFYPADDTRVKGTARFGAIKDANPIYPLQVRHYALRTSLDAASGTAPVYRVDVARMPAPDKLAASLGISGRPVEHRFGAWSSYEWSDKSLFYSPATGGYGFSVGLDRPSDESSAVASARQFLLDYGLLPADSRQQVEVIHVTPTPVAGMFSVAFHRRLGGLSVYGSGTTVVFPPQGGGPGDVLVMATHRPIAGGSNYPLRSAAAAWAQATARGWYMAEGFLHGDPGVLILPSFTADKVELCYFEADPNTDQEYLVPMYRFSDSQQHILLYTPALSSEYLPGGIS